MSTASHLVSFLFILIFIHGSVAQWLGQGASSFQSARRGSFRGCHFDQLIALEPSRQIRSEAGLTEYYDVNNEQLRCAGLSVFRRVIEPRGLLLPQYSNSPTLTYIIQGRGIIGPLFPGCPETFQQQFRQDEHYEEGQRSTERTRDEHQRINRFREGDIIALPAGVAHWCYNDGDAPVVLVQVSDVSNSANQLNPRLREFLLAGGFQGRQLQTPGYEFEGHKDNNVFRGFNLELLSEVFRISRDVARRLQGENDRRGDIVRVSRGLQLLRPSAQHYAEEEQHEEYGRPFEQEEFHRGGQYRGFRGGCNGLEENFCSMRINQNINNPQMADTYNPQAGRVTYLNSQKFPLLNLLQMSAVRGVLYRNAISTPFWNINAHELTYVTQGRGHIQVVNNRGRTVFHGELHRGQILLIPQNYVILKKAGPEGFQWVSFKTNQNAMISQLAGKSSVFRGLPVDVLTNSFRISREEARRIKFNRGNEMSVFSPRFGYYGRRNDGEVDEKQTESATIETIVQEVEVTDPTNTEVASIKENAQPNDTEGGAVAVE